MEISPVLMNKSKIRLNNLTIHVPGLSRNDLTVQGRAGEVIERKEKSGE
jgi:hypothetical protein